MIKTYSPMQIQVATFLCGPIVAAYLLKKSFESINQIKMAKIAFITSLIVATVILIALPFIPENIPNKVIPMLFTIPVIISLKKYYLTKDEIVNSEQYQIESIWKVIAISISGLIVTAILAYASIKTFTTGESVANNVVVNINNSDSNINYEFFIRMEAEKDPYGSGILLNFIVKQTMEGSFKHANPDLLRAMAIEYIGKKSLKELASYNVYVILNFKSMTNKLINKVVLSPSNIFKHKGAKPTKITIG